MPSTTTAPAATPTLPTRRSAAPARPRRGAHHRRLLGRPPGVNGDGDRSPTSSTGSSGAVARATSTSRSPATAGRPARPGVRRLGGLQVARGARLGDRPATTTPPSRSASGPLVDSVAAAQEADGYLNTMFGRPGQGERWSDLEWGHELYCVGHLFQAGVARARTRPEADDGLIDSRPPSRRPGLRRVRLTDGTGRCAATPEIEIGARRARTGRPASSATSTRRAVRRAPRPARWATSNGAAAYYQDDVPVRDAEALRGHAVRADYLASGAVDVAVETVTTICSPRCRPVGDARSHAAPI